MYYSTQDGNSQYVSGLALLYWDEIWGGFSK